jgi:hypothetical protein
VSDQPRRNSSTKWRIHCARFNSYDLYAYIKLSITFFVTAVWYLQSHWLAHCWKGLVARLWRSWYSASMMIALSYLLSTRYPLISEKPTHINFQPSDSSSPSSNSSFSSANRA